MNNSPLFAISPIDGRYATKTNLLKPYFSEYGLIKYRVQIEIEYFISLCQLNLPQLPVLSDDKIAQLRKIYISFSHDDAQAIKQIEHHTNHDVKAVEYFIKEAFLAEQLEAFNEFIHFGLTSQDINNTAIPLSILDYLNEQYFIEINKLISLLKQLAKEWEPIPMLARTHGQAATPTLLGKEIYVFVERLENQLALLQALPIACKFGGATGGLNAHFVAYPHINWVAFANEFCAKFGLKRLQHTTQIEHYDYLAALFDNMKRINTILIDFCRDIWHYISIDYFKQKTIGKEVGSSAMPHKVNPIDFENAEGNLGFANAILEHLAAKLPISRLQRDLTDSTVLRNIGVPMAHITVSLQSIDKGISKLVLNEGALKADLNQNYSVLAEAIQTILRREKYDKPYEALKDLTRGKAQLTQKDVVTFVNNLNISNNVKLEIMNLKPENYLGKYI